VDAGGRTIAFVIADPSHPAEIFIYSNGNLQQITDLNADWRAGVDLPVPEHFVVASDNAELDAWVAKLKSEGVTFLDGPYPLGETRAVMIEGPSREALELVVAG